ncbi:MAG TPA: hypothetical protein VGG14_16580 [Candidatus Sulfotelmatobacter sp.]|jgi:hypothetical protein
MTLKIPKQTKPTKPKAKSPGWHQLTLDELIHWAHAWKVQQTNPDNLFREKESATARLFGCNQSTISRRNTALVEVGAAHRLHHKERGQNQWFVESVLCVTVAPPASVLKLAQAAQEVRQALQSEAPYANVHTAPTRINSGDEPHATLHNIATDSSPHRHKPVSLESSYLSVIEHSSGVDANVHTALTRMNTGDEPRAKMHTDPEILKIERQLKDAEKKLARLRRDYREDEGIVAATRQQVDELRSRLTKVTP